MHAVAAPFSMSAAALEELAEKADNEAGGIYNRVVLITDGLTDMLPDEEGQCQAMSASLAYSAVPAFFYWVTPSWGDLALLAGVGATGTMGVWFVSRAYAYAEMSSVVPFDFLRLPIVAVCGWILFDETTDVWTVVGAGVIFACTYLLAWSETRSRRRAA